MPIREIHLKNVLTHVDTTIRLRERGIGIVVGSNGHGKSGAFVEGPAAALYGKTLRETPPWSGYPAYVRLLVNDLEVERSHSGKGSPKLTWKHAGDEKAKKYDSTTKAQDELLSRIPPFDVWKRTRVFSAADAAHFSKATDAERKRFLEDILGLSRFDRALKRCRSDAKEVTTAVAKLSTKAAVLRERVAGLERRLKDLDEQAAAELEVARPLVPPENVARIKRAVEAALADKHSDEKELRRLGDKLAHARSAVTTAQREHERLNRDACPTCGQDIPKSLISRLVDALTGSRKEVTTIEAELHSRSKELLESIQSTDEEVAELKAEIREAAVIEREHAAIKQRSSKHADARESLTSELDAARRDLAKLQADLSLQNADFAELEAVVQVLGLRGVRAQLLDKALVAITELANIWLEKLFNGVSVELLEQEDKVALRVVGLPHEYGYKACSSGQRRRVDIALLLGLSEFEAAAGGDANDDTLVFDEVADALDAEGFAAFTEVLHEISEQRYVLLITPRADLYQSIKATQRFSVHEGAVTEY